MPPVQMAIGVLVGIGLLVVCELRAARKYRITANAMDASAIAILFSTFYAGHVRWDLIGLIPAFIFMVLVTAVAVLLSIRRDSMFIALLGLIGAFATPALLSTAEDPVPLFSYILLLNAGLAWVATKKKWPILPTLTLIFTFLYQWGWVVNFLTYDQIPIAIGIFLVFPILAFIALTLGQKEEPEKGWISLHGQTANLSALLPLLFALYMAAVPEYGPVRRHLFRPGGSMACWPTIGRSFLLDPDVAGAFPTRLVNGLARRQRRRRLPPNASARVQVDWLPETDDAIAYARFVVVCSCDVSYNLLY